MHSFFVSIPSEAARRMSRGEERPAAGPCGDGVVTSSAAASGEFAAVPAEHPVAEREALRAAREVRCRART